MEHTTSPDWVIPNLGFPPRRVVPSRMPYGAVNSSRFPRHIAQGRSVETVAEQAPSRLMLGATRTPGTAGAPLMTGPSWSLGRQSRDSPARHTIPAGGSTRLFGDSGYWWLTADWPTLTG